MHELLGAPRRRALDRRRLLGVGQLALDGLQAHGQDVRLALACAQAPQEMLDLRPGPGSGSARIARAGVPRGRARAGRRGEAPLALGGLGGWGAGSLARGLRGHDQLGHAPTLVLGFVQPALQARDVRLERAHGRLGRFRSQHERVLAGLGRAAGAPFGQQITLAAPRAPLAAEAARLTGRLLTHRLFVSFSDHDACKLRAQPDGSAAALAAGQQANWDALLRSQACVPQPPPLRRARALPGQQVRPSAAREGVAAGTTSRLAMRGIRAACSRCRSPLPSYPARGVATHSEDARPCATAARTAQ